MPTGQPNRAVMPLEALLQPAGGVFRATTRLAPFGCEPLFATHVVRIRDVGLAAGQPAHPRRAMSGSGTALDDERATFLALAEGLERYSSCACDERQFITASADELGEAA